MTVAEKIIRFCESLRPPDGLPETVNVMNPYQDLKTRTLARTFYKKYYSDQHPRWILFGINPGRFGGGATGVPFTDPIRLEQICGISCNLDKKAELSSKFIYDVIAASGGPEPFYSQFVFSSVSPLGYTQNSKNLNYYDIKGWKPLFEKYAAEMIRKQLQFPVDRDVAFCIGQGQNLKFLSHLNEKYTFFREIKTVPHPRWVMQYRLKRKDEFVGEYLKVLNGSHINRAGR